MVCIKEKASEKDKNFLIDWIIKQYIKNSKHKTTKKELKILKEELQKMPLNKLVIRFNISNNSTWHECNCNFKDMN